MTTGEEHEKWLITRKKTFVSFCILCFGLGFEYSLIFPSLWYYMSSIINTDHPELFYGIAISAYPASSIIGAFTIARYADHTKRTRLVIFILLFCEIIGNLLYSIYFSPLYPIFGRLIAGFGDVANMVMVGEVSRSYETDEITSKISWMVMCFSVGFTLSPGMNILFKLFDFHIGPLHMVYANMPGLFMAICFVIIAVLSYFMVSDISRDFDLKASNEIAGCFNDKERDHKSNDKSSDVKGKQYGDYKSIQKNSNEKEDMYNKNYLGDEINDNNSISYLQEDKGGIPGGKQRNRKSFSTLRSILTSFDLVLLLVFGFICSYTLFGFDTLMSLITSKYFGFGVARTSIIFIIDGLLYGLVLLLIGKLSTRYSDFNIIVSAVIVQMLGQVAILSLSIYHTNIYFSYACLIVYILAFSTTWSIEEVLTRSLFGKLVPSSCQSYAEGIRRSVSSVAFIIAGITTAYLFEYLTVIFSVLIVLTLILLAAFICRKESLKSPTPLFGLDLEDEQEALLG